MFPATYVPESMHLDLLLKDMQKKHNHIVIVVNEYGITSGIVTIEDILEELVGEIWDEQDEEIDNIQKISDTEYRVLCSTSIEEFLNSELEPEEETEATTVNGWLIEISGNIPQEGRCFTYGNAEITVIKADDLMTNEISVKILEPAETPEEAVSGRSKKWPVSK